MDLHHSTTCCTNIKKKKSALCSNTHKTIIFRTPETDVTCPNMKYVKCDMPKTPRSPDTSSRIFLYRGPSCFRAFLTNNPLHSGRCIAYVRMCHTNTNKAEGAKTFMCRPFKCKHYVLCAPHFRAAKFKAHCHEVRCPDCIHTACNCVFFLRAAAAARTTSKK